MTGAYPVPLPAPPTDPYNPEDFRILTDGDTCDQRGCPAVAYVRVHMYQNGDRDTLAGTLHWCAHHWHDVAPTIWTMALNGLCSIIDESNRVS